MTTVAGRAIVAVLLGMVLCGARAGAAPRALSTDGEATAYLAGDFSRDFVVEYDVAFRTMAENKSWSTFAITYLAAAPPGDAVTVGVFAVAKLPHVFASVTRNGSSTFRDTGVVCAPACRLRLRGDRNGLSAFADERSVGDWPRFSLRGSAPAIQINGETSRAGDRLGVYATPLHITAAGRKLRLPACGFTTRGIGLLQSASGDLTFGGMYDPAARTTYLSLPDGCALDKCPPPRT